ncbi:MAG TPA: InlB B-repeat-containing protein [Clostridia bacterium]
MRVSIIKKTTFDKIFLCLFVLVLASCLCFFGANKTDTAIAESTGNITSLQPYTYSNSNNYFYGASFYQGGPGAGKDIVFYSYQYKDNPLPLYWQVSAKTIAINTGLLGLKDTWLVGVEIGGSQPNNLPFTFTVLGNYNLPNWNTTDSTYDFSASNSNVRYSQAELAAINGGKTFDEFYSSNGYATANNNEIASEFAFKLGDILFIKFGYSSGPGVFNINYISLYGPTGTIPLPEPPTKPGYTFVGWYWDAEFTIPYNGEPIYEDSTLYAKFEINQYTITFITNGGGTIAPIVTNYNTTIAEPTPPTKIGYIFAGWYLDEALTQPFDFGTPITQDIRLYAKWTLQSRTVTFIVDGQVYTTITVPFGTVLIDDATAAQYVAAMGKLYLDAEKKICLI